MDTVSCIMEKKHVERKGKKMIDIKVNRLAERSWFSCATMMQVSHGPNGFNGCRATGTNGSLLVSIEKKRKKEEGEQNENPRGENQESVKRIGSYSFPVRH